ncbi:MAG: type II secretion system protein [Deltaproteobacteria bacterium]|nr:type II secretion system protein [Deltaproteobacteria bacterium]
MRYLETASHSQRGQDSSVSLFLCVSRSTAGFTLIEIAVVLALIGMVMLLVIPRLPSSEKENLKISARTLASTLRYMQERAATSRTGYYLSLAPGTDSARIFEIGGDGGGKEPGDPLLQKAPLKEGIQVADVIIPRLGKVVDGQLRLDVGMGGLRDLVIIHLRSPAGDFWTLMAFPAGGKVKVYEGYLEEPA